jgi:hypothetical protein
MNTVVKYFTLPSLSATVALKFVQAMMHSFNLFVEYKAN